VGLSDARGGAEAPIFRATTTIALVVVGVFAFAAFVTLLAFAPNLDQDFHCRPNVASRCAIGFAGLEAVIRDDGVPLKVNRAKTLATTDTNGLLIATPEPEGGADIGALGFKGPILVILPKWVAAPDPNHVSWGLKQGPIPPQMMPSKDLLDVIKVDRRQGVARPRLTGAAGSPFEGMTLTPGSIDSLQTITANGWTPVLTDETGKVVIAQAQSQPIYVLADPDLLNTQGLADLDTFTAGTSIVRALRAGDGPVIFDLSLNGYANERNALQLMFRPPFLAVTLCVVAAMVLAGIQALFRFGPMRRPQRAIALGKEALTDNSAQLIRIARREPRMAPAYAALTRKAAARAVGAPRELAGEALTNFLDRLGRQRGLADNLASLSHEAGRVENRPGLTALAARLYRWRLEMTRERQ
jgi:hypothetical protein